MEERVAKEAVTKEEIVQYTINILTGITIPVMQSDTIGMAIKSAANNLIVLQEMMQSEKESKADGTAQAGDPEWQTESTGDDPGNEAAAVNHARLFPEDDGAEPKEDKNGNAEV